MDTTWVRTDTPITTQPNWWNITGEIKTRLEECGLNAGRIGGSIALVRAISLLLQNYNNSSNMLLHVINMHYTRQDNINCLDHIFSTETANSIIYVTKTSLSNRAITNKISEMQNNTNDYTVELVQNITGYLNQTNPVTKVVKVTKEGHSNILVFSNSILHDAMCSTLACLPTLFPDLFTNIKDAEQLNAIKNLCRAIGNQDNTQITEAMFKCVEVAKFPEPTIEFQALINSFKPSKAKQIQDLESKRLTYQQNIRNSMNNYATYVRGLADVEDTLATLRIIEDNDKVNTELIEELKSFKALKEYKIEGSEKHLTLSSPLMASDPELVQKILNSKATAEGYYLNAPAKRELFKQLFIDEKYRITCCTTIVYSGERTLPTQYKAPANPRLRNHTIPNPHLFYYRCLGGNERPLIDATVSGKLTIMLGILTSSNSNLNIGDSTVFRQFCKDMFSINMKQEILYDTTTKTYLTPETVLTTIQRSLNNETVQNY